MTRLNVASFCTPRNVFLLCKCDDTPWFPDWTCLRKVINYCCYADWAYNSPIPRLNGMINEIICGFHCRAHIEIQRIPFNIAHIKTKHWRGDLNIIRVNSCVLCRVKVPSPITSCGILRIAEKAFTVNSEYTAKTRFVLDYYVTEPHFGEESQLLTWAWYLHVCRI